MSLRKKISTYLKMKNITLWVFFKSLLSFFRHLFTKPDFTASYHPPEKALFLQIPKTATSTTLSLFLRKNDIPFDVNNYHSIHSKVNELYTLENRDELIKVLSTNEAYSFTFSRNPFTRLISCYLDKIKKEKDFAILEDYFGIFYEDMSFTEFAEQVCKIPDFWANTHFKSQHKFVFFSKTPPPRFIGRIEDYSKDIEYLQKKLSLPEQTQSFNTTSKKYKLDEWYTLDLAKNVYKRYKKDFFYFGYKPDFEQFYT